jgi:hypothetical protein
MDEEINDFDMKVEEIVLMGNDQYNSKENNDKDDVVAVENNITMNTSSTLDHTPSPGNKSFEGARSNCRS